ncbi:hypothetical protein L6164_017113 [Bauhinia variegata]|uniref:Uncharacterized protein n=1 Tax=Bauhinia variegata TaxID=167791 RepID=A0ACB9N731_BAUVA|nr:hypothetical protein L6164_017113 [Bauhinia variegata]
MSYMCQNSTATCSLSQLVDENPSIVQFTKKLCVMQDLTSKMLIEADIIKETRHLGAKPIDISVEENHWLALVDGALISNLAKYKRLVGRLIYLRFTRLELSYCIHLLSQFMIAQHWHAALQVPVHLAHCKKSGLPRTDQTHRGRLPFLPKRDRSRQ